MNDPYYTVEEAAKILHVHANTVREWCEQGRLAGSRKFGRKWLIPRKTIDPPDDQEEKKQEPNKPL